MPAPASADELLDLVRKSGIVDDDRLDAFLPWLHVGRTTTPDELANLLVRHGVLTKFQAEQFLVGKWRRFTIGKYKVLEKLGSGRMGTVYLCKHTVTGRSAAVKVLPTSAAQDPASVERFYREARALAAVSHPNIVRAYDIDQDDGLHFLVMEYVDGSSLQCITEKCGPMAVIRAAHYLRQAALGLQHAHEVAGIVHRGLKPADILVDRGGVVKIIDMGLARFSVGEEPVPATGYAGQVLGYPDYMAPEQAINPSRVDIRADLYSLGATFYFCLTRHKPFPGGTTEQKLTWLRTRQPEPIRKLRPKVPEGLAALIERMMAKEPGQRPRTPQEVAEALIPYTTEPIAPPPEDEMPRLSPAASGSNFQ